MHTAIWEWLTGAGKRLWSSAVAVYSYPLTWLAVGLLFVLGYILGFGQGVHGKRELRQRTIAAVATRDLYMKRAATLEAERNTLTDRVLELQKEVERLSHPLAPPPKVEPVRKKPAAPASSPATSKSPWGIW